MFFHRRLSDSKSPQVSRTLLSILAVFNNAVVWMVSTRPPTSKSSRSFNNPFVTVPKAPITIGVIVTLIFYRFFNSLARSRYLSLFSHSFSFIRWSAGIAKSTISIIIIIIIIIWYEPIYMSIWFWFFIIRIKQKLLKPYKLSLIINIHNCYLKIYCWQINYLKPYNHLKCLQPYYLTQIKPHKGTFSRGNFF